MALLSVGETIGSLVGVVVVDGVIVPVVVLVPVVPVVERELRPRLLRVVLFEVLVVVPVVLGEALGRSLVDVVVLGSVGIGIDVLGDMVLGEAVVDGFIVGEPVVVDGEVDGLVDCGEPVVLVDGDVLTPGLVWAPAAHGAAIGSVSAATAMR